MKNKLKELIDLFPAFLDGKRGQTKKILKNIDLLKASVQLPLGKNCSYSQDDYLLSSTLAAIANKTFEGNAGQFFTNSGMRILPSADEQLYQTAKLTNATVSFVFNKSRDAILELLSLFFRGRRIFVAIDYTRDIFYGCPTGNEFIVGGKRKNGTNYGYEHLVASIVIKGFSFVIFEKPIYKGSDIEKDLQEVMEAVTSKFDVFCFLLDREFYKTKIINYLQMTGEKFIIPTIRNERLDKRLGSICNFPVMIKHTMTDQKRKEQAVFDVVVLEREKNGERKTYGFATNFDRKQFMENAELVAEWYDKRWGIENVFKVSDQFQLDTYSVNPVIRHFSFVFSLMLYNLWVFINLQEFLEGKSEFGEVKIRVNDVFWSVLFSGFINLFLKVLAEAGKLGKVEEVVLRRDGCFLCF